MGFYTNQIFPKLTQHFFNSDELDELRARLLEQAYGHVLEIGSGTGSNFLFYTDAVTTLTTVDPSIAMNRIARGKFRYFDFPIDQKTQRVEDLTAKDATFDTIVSTFTLCTIQDPQQGLVQAYRVLKPGGKLIFLERSRSPDPGVSRWQDRLTPFHKLIWSGSHLNRPVEQHIGEAGFSILNTDELSLPGLPKVFGTLLYGTAQKNREKFG